MVTFETVNNGDEAHELAFLPGGGEVPLTADGAPDEDALGEAGAFELEAYGPGQECDGTFALEAGTYTVFCLVEASDGKTHLAKGMRGEAQGAVSLALAPPAAGHNCRECAREGPGAVCKPSVPQGHRRERAPSGGKGSLCRRGGRPPGPLTDDSLTLVTAAVHVRSGTDANESRYLAAA